MTPGTKDSYMLKRVFTLFGNMIWFPSALRYLRGNGNTDLQLEGLLLKRQNFRALRVP